MEYTPEQDEPMHDALFDLLDETHDYDVIDYIFYKYNQTYSSIHICNKYKLNTLDIVIDLINDIYFKFTFDNNKHSIEITLFKLTPNLKTFVNTWIEIKNSLSKSDIDGHHKHFITIVDIFMVDVHKIHTNMKTFVGDDITSPWKAVKHACMDSLFQFWIEMTYEYLDECIALTFK